MPQSLGIPTDQYQPFYQALSSVVPLLKIDEGEDYGWNYQIFHEGRLQAECYKRYLLLFELRCMLAEGPKYFPDLSPEALAAIDRYDERQVDAVLAQTQVYREAFEDQYRNRNVEAFRFFGVEAPVLRAIEEVLQATFFPTSGGNGGEERKNHPAQSISIYQETPYSKGESNIPLDKILQLIGVDTALLWSYEHVLQWRQEGLSYNPMGETS